MNAEGLYRTADLRDEDRAVAEISARVMRLRQSIAIGTVVVAIALAVIGYFAVSAYYLAQTRNFDPRVGFLGVAPPLALLLPVGGWLQQLVVNLRGPRWLREIGAVHGVEPARLRGLLEMW